MIDVTFDCQKDTKGPGADPDPDSHSPSLRRYHQLLWSKPLPCGKLFSLEISGPKPFLVHRSDLGEFYLTSDNFINTYSSWRKVAPLVPQLSESMKNYAEALPWLVGDCIVFPGKRINKKITINGARGINQRICDRFDLTLECIRRHYLGEKSPLADDLERYASFFALFEDFKGYVEFFLLQDLVEVGDEKIKFYLPFDDFKSSPLPKSVEEYDLFLRGLMRFSNARAQRILEWSSTSPKHT